MTEPFNRGDLEALISLACLLAILAVLFRIGGF